MSTNRFIKDPDADLDYKFDYKAKTNGSGTFDFLGDGETITDVVIIAGTGITAHDENITDDGTSVTVWLVGGSTGENYTITSRITTSARRVVDHSIVIRVRQQ